MEYCNWKRWAIPSSAVRTGGVYGSMKPCSDTTLLHSVNVPRYWHMLMLVFQCCRLSISWSSSCNGCPKKGTGKNVQTQSLSRLQSIFVSFMWMLSLFIPVIVSFSGIRRLAMCMRTVVDYFVPTVMATAEIPWSSNNNLQDRVNDCKSHVLQKATEVRFLVCLLRF